MRDKVAADAALHLTTIYGQFKSGVDIPIGPHCFIGREGLLKNWMNYPFVEAYETNEDLLSAAEHIGMLSNILVPVITERLNHLNQRNYTEKFWRIIILPWLLELIQKTWVTFLRLEKLKVSHGDRRVKIFGLKGYSKQKITNTLNFQELLFFDYRFNWWLDTKIAEIQLSDNWVIEWIESIEHPKHIKPAEIPRKKSNYKLFSMLRWIKYSMGYSDIGGIRLAGLMLSAYLNLLPKKTLNESRNQVATSSVNSYFPKRYLELLNYFILELFPESFTDGFNKLEQTAQKLLYFNGRLRLGTLDFWNEQEKVIWALAAEKGERIVLVQHGGEYGITDYNILVNEIELKSDFFISWGWADPKVTSARILPLPSPFHSKIKNKHRFRNDTLMILGGGVRILNSRVHWWTRSNLPGRYYGDALKFIQSLEEEPQNSITFKPYNRWASEIDTIDFVKDKFPNIKIHEGDFNSALLSCRLIVFYSFGTTMNFTMAANVPTVVYLSPDLMIPNKYAEPFFNPLRECGILHDSPLEAAKHVNSIWHDVETWWMGEKVQKARNEWAHNFAQTSKFWWWEWMKALKHI